METPGTSYFCYLDLLCFDPSPFLSQDFKGQLPAEVDHRTKTSLTLLSESVLLIPGCTFQSLRLHISIPGYPPQNKP